MLHVDDAGSGPAVLLLHGTPSPPSHFGPLAQALRLHHRVLVPDLPGYGRSPPLEGSYAVERVTVLLENELLARGCDELDVVGFSGGAYRAFALALSSRVRVRRLFSIAGYAGADEAMRVRFRGIAQLIRNGVDLRGSFAGGMLSSDYSAAHPAGVAVVTAWLDAAPMTVLAAEFDAFAEAPDLRPRLASLSCAVTLRVGSEDLSLPPTVSREIASIVPGATLTVVPGCGHALLCEDHEATIAAVCAAVAPERLCPHG